MSNQLFNSSIFSFKFLCSSFLEILFDSFPNWFSQSSLFLILLMFLILSLITLDSLNFVSWHSANSVGLILLSVVSLAKSTWCFIYLHSLCIFSSEFTFLGTLYRRILWDLDWKRWLDLLLTGISLLGGCYELLIQNYINVQARTEFFSTTDVV